MTDSRSTNLYFDQSGLLVRLVRWTVTPVGLVPTQIDYKDYRDVAGVKMPFQWTVSQTYMQMTIDAERHPAERGDRRGEVQQAGAREIGPLRRSSKFEG